jgi:multiple sugar transport system permease protein
MSGRTRTLVIIPLLLGSVMMAFPFYWMFVTNLASPAEASAAASAKTFKWLPSNPHWNNYPTALQKMGVALNSFQNQYGDFSAMNLLMAASIVTMLPCVVLFFVAQKQFVGGLSLGAVKG